MSEKRFTLRNSNAVSSNYPSQRVYDNKLKRELYNSEIVDLLNELSDENNILNKNEDDLEECTIENIKLKEENEQLRILLNEAEDMIETRLAEHYIKQYKNIKKGILDE